jgi:hypothetical protein
MATRRYEVNYPCPCGKGRINYHITSYDNAYAKDDILLSELCRDCRDKYQYQRFQGNDGIQVRARKMRSKEELILSALKDEPPS